MALTPLDPLDSPATSPPYPATHKAWPRWLTVIGLWLALTSAAAVTLWHLRSDALDGQARELSLLSLALTDEVDRGLQGAEDGLQALRTELGDGRLPIRGREAERALQTRAQLMQLVQTLWLVDAEGHILSGSDTTPAPDLATLLPLPPALAEGATALSRPFTDPLTQLSVIALATRFAATPDRAGGWILAAIPAKLLLGAFAAAAPAADARMAVLRSDGVRLAGTDLGPHSALRRFGQGDSNGDSDSDSIVSQHSVPRYGLQVVVSRGLGAVLTGWRGAAGLTAGAFVLLLLITLVSLHFVQRAGRRRAEAQHALQVQRSRASRLEALGTLAGGVAHDFNNVLAAILGFGEMAQDAASAGSDQARQIDRVLQAALRGQALIQRILAFSSGGARQSSVFELQPIIEEVLALLSATLRPGVVLELALEAPAARLRGDATQAFEAVMNLCTNALQAMPRGGMLSLQLTRETVAAARVLSHSRLAAGHYLMLTVADQGVGITPAVLEHLFEPFFTTRSAESGTGLGLAVVHGVVSEFGGAIDVQSQPGQGACFTLYWPESVAAVAAPDTQG